MKKIRIGSGAGYAGDRLEPALELIEKGNVDYVSFECLAERTIALAQMAKLKDPTKGYNGLLEYRMEKVIPLAHKHNVKIITNMGAANPQAAIEVCAEIAKKHGISGLKIAAVFGDDVLDLMTDYQETHLWETKRPLKELEGEIISANAYIGVDGILEALASEADIIITGRVADPAIFMAPLIHEFGWAMDDWNLLGVGTAVGHLLECGGQVTGGYFAEPGKKDVENLDLLGFPIVEIDETGEFFVTKVEGSGGKITTHTCTEQLLYEIHDPSQYITPDVIADFSNVTFEEVAPNKIKVSGATGKARPETLKVSLGYKDCFIGEGEISYGGRGCLDRARLAGEIVESRLKLREVPMDEIKIDYIGVNSLYWNSDMELSEPNEVRLRVAARTKDAQLASRIGEEVETLYTNGPAGGCGATKSTKEIISVASMLIDRNDVTSQVVYQEV